VRSPRGGLVTGTPSHPSRLPAGAARGPFEARAQRRLTTWPVAALTFIFFEGPARPHQRGREAGAIVLDFRPYQMAATGTRLVEREAPTVLPSQ
jgi:hypothetical protein